jgi:ketosteroid isomerase-like protein
MGAVAAFAAHASSRRIFFTGALLPRRKSQTGVRNLGTRVRDSATGKNDRANEEEEEEDESTSNALASLERELSLQISLENYAEAAKLRDSIALLKRDDLVAVETCNSLFYDAFRRGDFTLMHSKVWGSGAHVRCTHPGMPTVLGDENVKESWRIVFESMGGAGGSGSASSSTSQQKMDVKCKSVQAYANGNLGIVTCEEVVMRASTLTCTNVFEKQGGEWRMIQHHASAVFPGSVAAGGSSASSSS